MEPNALHRRVDRLFLQAFTAMDLAEPLISFDGERDADDVRLFMEENRLRVIGLRRRGVVSGYAEHHELGSGPCRDAMHPFDEDQLLSEQSSIQDVIFYLRKASFVFVTVLGQVGAIVTRTDIQKAPARMWLFGMITLLEMSMSRRVEADYPDDAWRDRIAAGRLEKAGVLQEERKRRGQDVRLVDCLQLSDKARIVMSNAEDRAKAGFESKRAADRAIRDLESLRNSLAHAQDIVTHNWDAIAMVSRYLDSIVARV